MRAPVILGGLKILKGLTKFSVILHEGEDCTPVLLLSAIAGKEINLPYLSYVRANKYWALNMMVGREQSLETSQVIEKHAGKRFISCPSNGILSIFPHKNNPKVIAELFKSFHWNEVSVCGLANSLSTISVILKEDSINAACNALFKPFMFSTCNDPDSCMLAQKGKEETYREVIASYRQLRPKVYGLEYYKGQSLIHIGMTTCEMAQIGSVFEWYAGHGLDLTFSVMAPFQEEGEYIFSFCLTDIEEQDSRPQDYQGVNIRYKGLISPVIVFSMNGPHFGDRYGIARDLLASLEEYDVNIFCLSCTTSSITGVIPSSRFDSLIEAINACFEAPSITEKKKGQI